MSAPALPDPARDQDDDLAGVDFLSGVEGAVGALDATATPRAARVGRRRFTAARLAAMGILAAGMVSCGVTYAMATGSSGRNEAGSGDPAAGRQLYESSCITCHGANLQGVQGRGVPLDGVGESAVYFQVSTGRMPLAAQGAMAKRKEPEFTEQETLDLAAYVQQVGGGPTLPEGSLRVSADQVGTGGDLFRLNCAQCHGVTGKGGALSAGKYAPTLEPSTDLQIYTAMQSGPENMPVFADNQLTPEQKRQIITYIQTMKASKDPGGASIGRIGPASEAVVIWVAGVGAVLLAILWIGSKVS